MKIVKNSTVERVLLGFVFICALVNSIYTMDPSPQGFNLKIESLKKNENIWVETLDRKKLELPKWQIDQMKALQVSFVHQRGRNSKENPINASMVSYENLMLVKTALNIASNLENFTIFYNNLIPKQKASLINTAFNVEAIGLASLLTEVEIPVEMQELIGATIIQKEGIIAPVISYLNDSNNLKNVLMGKNEHQWPDQAIFSPNGDYICSVGESFIGLWNTNTGEKIKSTYYASGECVAFSPDGKKVISGSTKKMNNLTLWDIDNSNNFIPKDLEAHNDWVDCVAFSPDGMRIISGGARGQVILWDISNRNHITHLDLVGHSRFGARYSHIESFVRSVAFSPDGNYIVSATDGAKNNLILWNGRTGDKIKILDGHSNDVTCAAFSPDGNYIISGSAGSKNNLILWDGRTGDKIKILDRHPKDVTCVAFSPDGNHIISGSSGTDNNLILWDISPIVTKNKLPYFFFSLKNYESGILPQDIIQLISQNLSELSQLNISSQNLKGHDLAPSGHSGTSCVAYSPDGKYIISGGWGDESLILWDAKIGKKIKVENLNGPIKSVAFSPNSGSVVCTGGYGGYYLILFKLIDSEAVDFIARQLDIAQARLLYRLYLARLNKVPVIMSKNDLDYAIYKTLSENVKKIIDTFFPFKLAPKSFRQLVEKKKNIYRSLLVGKTISQKKAFVKQAMESSPDKNSVEYEACQELLFEFEEIEFEKEKTPKE